MATYEELLQIVSKTHVFNIDNTNVYACLHCVKICVETNFLWDNNDAHCCVQCSKI